MGSRTVQHARPSGRPPSPLRLAAGTALAVGGALALLSSTQSAYAIGTAVGLGTATSYSVLGGESVSNTGPSVLNGDLGVSPGTALTGFTAATVGGDTHSADAHALQAQADLTTAYDDAAGQVADESVDGDLGNRTLLAGVYNASSSIGLTGTLTLDAEGDPNAVFIFQVGSALTTAPSSTVALVNGARSCNVFWQIGSSATLDTATTFVGTIMALTSITLNNGATVDGRALARNGSVTLENNVFTGGACVTEPTEAPTTDTPTTAPPTDSPPTDTPTTASPTGGATTTSPPAATTTSELPTPAPGTSTSGTSSAPPGGTPFTGQGPPPVAGQPGGPALPDTGASLTTALVLGALTTTLAGVGLVALRKQHSHRAKH